MPHYCEVSVDDRFDIFFCISLCDEYALLSHLKKSLKNCENFSVPR